jgi:holliday junction DNA helicase RuvA
MISYLSGTIKFKYSTSITLLTSGVGYKVFVPADIMTASKIDDSVELFIHTHVKEDALDLYGFTDSDSLMLFELLIGVSGIGPKTALNIFSNGKSEKIKEAIVKGDVAFFTSVPRLGTKNAQKIIIELRGKLGSIGSFDVLSDSGETREIIEALRSFGFKDYEAKEALKNLKDFEGDVEAKIKQALKYLGGK